MRNLKKVLVLIMVLALTVGLMGTAIAAAPGTYYLDDSAIENYDEAIQVMTALGICRGNGSREFRPNDTITRAEVAVLIYRIVTGDLTGKYVNIYADYNKFADVDSAAWYAGYVNFCANGEYLKGDGTNFYPMENITGYQVLAIMLRVIGYGMENEFEGANWHIRTASLAADLGITANITAGTLGAYSTRGMVIEMLYRAIAQTSVVKYDRINVYTPVNATYAFLHFGLVGQRDYWLKCYSSYHPDSQGIYPAEGYKWMITRNNAVADSRYGEPIAYWYVIVDLSKSSDSGSPSIVVGSIPIRFNPVASFSTAVTGGQLYVAAGLSEMNCVVENLAVDGIDSVGVVLSPNDKTEYGGKGTTTEVFSVEGFEYVVIKHTYVLYNAPDDEEHKELTIYGVVLHNRYDGKVDYASTRAARVLTAQTVDRTYDTGEVVRSYFFAEGVRYEYSAKYGATFPDPILNCDKLVPAGTCDQDIYFDDFGYVICTSPTRYGVVRQTGYLVIRRGTYGTQVADNRWINQFDVILADGTQTSISGALNDMGYYTTQAEASDAAAADLGVYRYEIKDGYYALSRIDAGGKDGDDIIRDSRIDAGDGNALEAHPCLVDAGTMFVIAEYDETGAINNYKCVRDFRKIPDLSGDMKVELIHGESAVAFAFIQNAVQTPNAIESTTEDHYFCLLDPIPEKQVNEYDRHVVQISGVVTTMDFVKGAAPKKTGLYFVAETSNGLVAKALPADDLLKNVSFPASCVMKAINASGVESYYALAENCVTYSVKDPGFVGTAGVIAATDQYGYVTVLYIISGV